MIIENCKNEPGVYKISHPDTSKLYIGSAENLLKRAKTHERMIDNNTHHSKNLKIFANKVDKSLFQFSILEKVNDISKLEEREQFYLNLLLKANENNADFFRLGFNGDRLSIRNSGSNSEKPILQYDLTGNFIKEWRSALIASKTLNIQYTSLIQAVTRKKLNYKSAGNFQWRPYVENYPLVISKYINPHLKKIIMYDKNGKFIKVFPSFSDINKEFHISRASVVKSCEKDIIVTNFRFRYYTKDFSMDIGKHTYYLSKNIHVYIKQTGEFIGVFDSFAEVSRVTNVAGITVSKKLNKIDKGWCKYIFFTNPLSDEVLNSLK